MNGVLLVSFLLLTISQKSTSKPLASNNIGNPSIFENLISDLNEIKNPFSNRLEESSYSSDSSIDLVSNEKVKTVDSKQDSNDKDKKVDMTHCETRIVWEKKPVCHQNVCVDVSQSKVIYDCIAVKMPVP